MFVATWVCALLYWRIARVEERWNAAVVADPDPEIAAT